MATYCRHPYIQLRARSSVSLRSGGSILQSKAGPFLASGEVLASHSLYGKSNAQIRGVIRDPQGAVIVGATVNLLSLERARKTKTDENVNSSFWTYA